MLLCTGTQSHTLLTVFTTQEDEVGNIHMLQNTFGTHTILICFPPDLKMATSLKSV
jgi:hypothetical protein